MISIRKAVVGTGIAAAAVAGGALGASLIGNASAQTVPSTTSSTTAGSSTGSSTTGTTPDANRGPHTANGKTETVLTGTNLTKATAAAKAAVPGGTVDRAETDADGAVYEVHMTKSDGSKVTVKLDASFKVTAVQSGMGS